MDAPKKPHFMKQMLTGKDNETHDIAKWIALVIALSAVIYEGYIVFTQHSFDAQSYALGMTTLLVGLGGALKLKETTEPDAKSDSVSE